MSTEPNFLVVTLTHVVRGDLFDGTDRPCGDIVVGDQVAYDYVEAATLVERDPHAPISIERHVVLGPNPAAASKEG